MWASGDYPEMVTTFLLPVGERLVEAAGIAAGAKVLDVAAGTGNASLVAAARGADVTASDLTPELLDAGRARAAEAGLELEWPMADAEALPFEDASFDVVMSCIGVMFAPHHQAAADELVRVCRPGGTIALLSWTPEGMIGGLFRAMKEFAPPPPPGAQSPPLWGSEDHVQGLFGGRVEFTTLEREDLDDHRVPAGARLRRALQGLLRPDDRRPCQRRAQRRRRRVRRRASTRSATSGTAARRTPPASSRSTWSRWGPAPPDGLPRAARAQADQPIAGLQLARARVVEGQDLAVAHEGHGGLGRAQVGQGAPGLVGVDLALDDVEPLADGEQVLEHLHDGRALHGLAEQLPRRARGQDHGVRAALAQQVDVLGLAGGGDDRRARC